MHQMLLAANFLLASLASPGPTPASSAATPAAVVDRAPAKASGARSRAPRPKARAGTKAKAQAVAQTKTDKPKAPPASPAPKGAAPSTPAPAPAPATPAKARTAAELVAAVQKYYVGIDKLEADFKQTYTNSVFGKRSESTGRLYIAKPGKMRWDYVRPTRKQFISDGSTLWVAEPANKQAYKQNLKDQVLPVAVTFLYGQGDLSKDFTAVLDPGKHGGKDDLVLKLTPKQPSAQYKHLWLVVDPADFHVKESIILEASGNTNQFRFVDLKTNADAKFAGQAKYYRFTPPKDWRVVTGKAPEAGK